MLKQIELEKIASIRTPMVFRDKSPEEVPHGNARVFSIKDLVSSRSLQVDTLPLVEVSAEKLGDSLKPGDVLIPGRGLAYPARLFEGAVLPIFPSGQIHVVSVVSGSIDPGYLTWFLNRKNTQAQIEQLLMGATIKALNKSQLARLPVLIPTLQTQAHIASLYQLTSLRMTLRDQLFALENEELEATCFAALEKEAQHA